VNRRDGPRISQTERAYTEIRRRILENELSAGTQVLEQELAEMLEMSRTPVREAMVRLADEGMVEVRPRHGMRVLPISADDMREIYDVLTALESMAAERVAARGVSPEELRALKQAVADMDAALAVDDLRTWAAADERFHLLLVEYCDNERLRALVSGYWDQSHRVRLVTLGLRPKPVDSNKDHAAVVDAIARGDAVAARRLHRQHRVRSGETLVNLLKTHGLTQL
jgi:DNA-binding GntR family transcriptional regulator